MYRAQKTMKFQNKKIIIIITSLLALQGFMMCSNQNEGKEGPNPPAGYSCNTMLKIWHFLGFLDLVDTEPKVPSNITEFKDIVYKKTGSRDLKLDIYQPNNIKQPTPVLVFIHGGGWTKGDKSDYLRYLVDFAQKGYVTATISYRFSQEAVFPGAVEDVKCAIRWIRTHAKDYQIDPDKIAVIGGSAGGHLAMMIAYSSDVKEFDMGCGSDSVSSRVQVVVNLYGPSDLTTEYAIAQPSPQKFIGGLYKTDSSQYKKASPLYYITPDDPPTLIFHGTIDDLVPVVQSDRLKQKLETIGVQNEYHKLEGWPHTMDLAVSVNGYCQYYMTRFFETHISQNNSD
jgi:acetyl esterase/lipase